ncbi:acyltransferase [Magnetospirillum gryphiswaldense]|uniref:Acetyltransferase (Isoleucine patch superfamily) n=1 Tax=Magnetospirillum gryphiswaldense TaxID=55518 RepID=A4U174_9PROT|nr:acyltransferase [Magnetospirillum gryphiswaldense]AVM75588.1 Maltose O-acetyltransferase [Magnetospirillum gryphiswaldense MSR-1]AVM79491.1 Maltose O-acetyltransferase [Magnetospirillum gryphiswaldense]CAM76631.1 Acetyltransferase (isoleucine patch superfamily) [Magnetospirillum gryphiswaldense MSR-1]
MNTVELAKLLRKLHEETDENLREEFSRSLSFQDGFFNRWDRAKRLGFGESTQIYNSVQVLGDVNIGSNSFVGAFSVLDGGYAPVRIGSFVSISAGVHIYSHDTVMWSLSGGHADKRIGAVTICDCTYVGSQSVIACGVTVGRQSVVASNSFVNDSVPDRTVVGGSPARVIGRVIEDGDQLKVVFE